MSSIQIILENIPRLNSEELAIVLKEILARKSQPSRMRSILARYKGKGKGVWLEDAQGYVNKLREDDRL